MSRSAGLLLALSIVSGASTARAQLAPIEDEELVAAPPTPPAAGALAAAALTFRSGLVLQLAPAVTPPGGIRWSARRGVLFDERVRGALVADARGQEIAALISDVTLFTTIGLTVAIDAGLVPLLRGEIDLAWQAELAWAYANGITQSIGELVKRAAARARPYVRACDADPEAPGCESEETTRSFFSMHAASAFTAAGVSCALHLERRVYGDQAADLGSCGASLALATTTGVLRIVADRHYASDVLVGSLLGLAVGYVTTLALVPPAGGASSLPRFAVTPLIGSVALTGEGPSVDGVLGVSAIGAF